MKVVIEKQAVKYLESLDTIMYRRITKALKDLEKEPPIGDIEKLSGQDGYRLRVGIYRILFRVGAENIRVHKIAPRGQAYKE
jgi:mRNA interferase RelE/StbE